MKQDGLRGSEGNSPPAVTGFRVRILIIYFSFTGTVTGMATALVRELEAWGRWT